ncbi:transposase OrfAB, subunit B [Xenorhabdus mauleonii]|uniref:Putative transposase n=1 Tax=Xenorhabdus mauleonii TaxID=351675 RepID=A0A1I3XSU3_9GAMM|nr:transposase OrfAB, subunit B [Xenorhabdus mauleonii]SFK22369.1 putative transposase [Xenorhabdus mauleonii]
MTRYPNFSKAAHAVTNYIVRYYSTLRPHAYTGGLPPNESENRFWKNANAVTSFSRPTSHQGQKGSGLMT